MVNITLIAIALALDAFGVALGIGCGQPLDLRERSSIIFSFGFFQFGFAFIGAILGSYINNNLFNITGYVSGIIILGIGILLLKEGYENQDEETCRTLSFWTFIILGISVSIDALGVGFSLLYKLDLSLLVANSIYIGLISSILTFLSLFLVKYIRNINIVEKYADFIGGGILIIFGLKMFIG